MHGKGKCRNDTSHCHVGANSSNMGFLNYHVVATDYKHYSVVYNCDPMT